MYIAHSYAMFKTCGCFIQNGSNAEQSFWGFFEFLTISEVIFDTPMTHQDLNTPVILCTHMNQTYHYYKHSVATDEMALLISVLSVLLIKVLKACYVHSIVTLVLHMSEFIWGKISGSIE